MFRFVRDRLLAGDPPTVREVQEVFGFRTPHTARYHLEKLVAERRLSAARGKARGYRLPTGGEPASPVGWVPLLELLDARRPAAGPMSPMRPRTSRPRPPDAAGPPLDAALAWPVVAWGRVAASPGAPVDRVVPFSP